MEEKVIKFIRNYYREAEEKTDEYLKSCFYISENEVCKEGYSDYNYTKALSLYTLHVCAENEKRSSCDTDARVVVSEKIDDISTSFRLDPINGVTPLNIYHRDYLLVPNCRIKSSFNVDVIDKSDAGACDNMYFSTDFKNHLVQ